MAMILNIKNSQSKRVLIVTLAFFVGFVLLIAQNIDASIWTGGSGKFLQYEIQIREVWHHSQTIGVLSFRGVQRNLVECQLILIEGR